MWKLYEFGNIFRLFLYLKNSEKITRTLYDLVAFAFDSYALKYYGIYNHRTHGIKISMIWLHFQCLWLRILCNHMCLINTSGIRTHKLTRIKSVLPPSQSPGRFRVSMIWTDLSLGQNSSILNFQTLRANPNPIQLQAIDASSCDDTLKLPLTLLKSVGSNMIMYYYSPLIMCIWL